MVYVRHSSNVLSCNSDMLVQHALSLYASLTWEFYPLQVKQSLDHEMDVQGVEGSFACPSYLEEHKLSAESQFGKEECFEILDVVEDVVAAPHIQDVGSEYQHRRRMLEDPKVQVRFEKPCRWFLLDPGLELMLHFAYAHAGEHESESEGAGADVVVARPETDVVSAT
jgi:hypothetical protein